MIHRFFLFIFLLQNEPLPTDSGSKCYFLSFVKKIVSDKIFYNSVLIKNTWNKGKDCDLTALMEEELLKMKSEQLRGEPPFRANSFSAFPATLEEKIKHPLRSSDSLVVPPRPPRPVSDNLSKKPPAPPPRRNSTRGASLGIEPALRPNISDYKNRPHSMKVSPPKRTESTPAPGVSTRPSPLGGPPLRSSGLVPKKPPPPPPRR